MMDFIEKCKRINAISDIGLLYAQTGFETERYKELKQISLEMISEIAGMPLKKVENFYAPASEYPTVKVDVRAFVLNEKKEILMVQEHSDGNWALPGGWADIGYSPSETAVKEVKEEAGLEVICKRVLAVYDNRCHAHPPQPYYIYKIILYCEVTGGALQKGFDILDVNFFNSHSLPVLSENRIVKSQIMHLHSKVLTGDYTTSFD